MATEQGTVLHKGYMVQGEERIVPGGFTVIFQEKRRGYYVLQYFGPNNLLLYGYKDEKAFLKPSSKLLRKGSTESMIRLVAGLKVHKIEMKMRKKVENVLILVNGSHPKYFRPDNKAEMEEWFRVFRNNCTETNVRRRQRTVVPVNTQQGEEATTKLAKNLTHFSPDHDSGLSSTTSSPRSSQGSTRSSSSSDETNFSPPSSPNILPTSVFFDPNDSDEGASPSAAPPTTTNGKGMGSRNESWRKSFFVRGRDGQYEERPLDDQHNPYGSSLTVPSPGRLRETGGRGSDGSTHRDDERQAAGNSPHNGRTDSNGDGADVKIPHLYDRLPLRVKARSLVNDDIKEEMEPPPLIPKKTGRNSRQSSQEHEDEPDSAPSVPRRKPSNLTAFPASPELQEILNDDGTKHTYINQRRASRSSIVNFDVEVDNSPVKADIDRRTSLPGNLGEPADSVPRRRLDTMPLPQSHQHTPSEVARELKGDETLATRPLPKPDLHLSLDIETLMWEQAQDAEVLVVIAKEDVQDSLAIVDVRGKVWIAGWKPACSRNVFGKLHVGDQVIQVNDQVVNQATWANTCIETSSKSKITLHIRRLPHAKIVNCKRSTEETPWGMDVKGNEIKEIKPGPVKESGLTTKMGGAFSPNKQYDLIITEIAYKPIKFSCGKDDVRRHLETKSLELPIVSHPKDFVKELSNALAKIKHSSQFHVG